ncbi:hypothetical protein SAMN02745824_2635 [Parasphingorhabdus marina DSM 22363]|uniref:Uncharacterized protein n=2 Tax=Parasphingorhabdus marina TaxID=394732 RepID=A0A1N6G1G6_9SPHN|nr:hypothetical protein SAMN02745824_2635 [Parasphingorhabdus marina DSM 22363]
MYIAKNAVSDDDTIANGARLQGLSSLLSYCMVPGPDGKPKLNLSSLDTEEMMQYTTFVPDGPMSDLAKCLVDSAPNEASAFIVAADRLAVSKYLAEKSFGAFPDDAFVKMVEASDGCGDLLNEPVKAVMLYTDINWFVRVVTKHDDIIAWHKQAGGS